MARTKQTARKTPEQLAEMQEERERIYGASVVVKSTKPKRARIPKKSQKKDVTEPKVNRRKRRKKKKIQAIVPKTPKKAKKAKKLEVIFPLPFVL